MPYLGMVFFDCRTFTYTAYYSRCGTATPNNNIEKALSILNLLTIASAAVCQLYLRRRGMKLAACDPALVAAESVERVERYIHHGQFWRRCFQVMWLFTLSMHIALAWLITSNKLYWRANEGYDQSLFGQLIAIPAVISAMFIIQHVIENVVERRLSSQLNASHRMRYIHV